MDYKSANRRAASFSWAAATPMYDAAQQAADHFAKALEFSREAGADPEMLEDLRILLLDEFLSHIQYSLNRMLDDNGNRIDLHQIDVGSLKK